MHRPRLIALCGATLAVVLAPNAAALAAGAPKVTISVEGRTRTLLAPTVVHTHAGSISKGGAPSGACPASSAQGALDVATHHRWGGKWFSSYQEYEITTILGDTEGGTHFFWEIFVNNVEASSGACEIRLHRGDQLLFAAVPATGIAYPLALSAPHHVTAGHPFAVKVVWFNAKGKAKPLAGATVNGTLTDSHGIARITPTDAGTLVLRAGRNGYIRATPVSVRVSG